MSGSTTSTPSNFKITIQKGATSGSAQPSPGGNGQTPATITAQANTKLFVYFTIEGTKMRTGTDDLDPSQSPVGSSIEAYQEPVNNYTLIVNLTEPAPTNVIIEGWVEYVS